VLCSVWTFVATSTVTDAGQLLHNDRDTSENGARPAGFEPATSRSGVGTQDRENRSSGPCLLGLRLVGHPGDVGRYRRLEADTGNRFGLLPNARDAVRDPGRRPLARSQRDS
jgi:hypothetical protein